MVGIGAIIPTVFTAVVGTKMGDKLVVAVAALDDDMPLLNQSTTD